MRLKGQGDCDIQHIESGAILRSSKSPVFGGSGRSFSSSDLVAAGLGSCIATDLEAVAERHGLAPAEIEIEVDKHLATSPKRIAGFDVHVSLPGHVDDVLLVKLQRAARTCLVWRSLGADVRVEVDFTRRM